MMTEGQVFGARRNPASVVDRRDERAGQLLSRLGLRRDAQARRHLPEIRHRARVRRAHRARSAICSGTPRTWSRTCCGNTVRNYKAKQAATVVMENDGTVRAMIGGRDYGTSQFNRATDAMRQPGSSFKPYVYAAALMGGLKPTSIVVDGPICIGNWCPHNYAGGYSGSMPLDERADALDQHDRREAVDHHRQRQRAGPAATRSWRWPKRWACARRCPTRPRCRSAPTK